VRPLDNRIKSVDAAGPLRGRVRPGDTLLSVNGKLILDVLDYKYYCYDRDLLMEFRTAEGKIRLVRVRKPEGADPGLTFETYLMDRPRSCANDCVFCFIDQNPPGMRKSIYFKDDDARLSFLMGCYITLTNLTQREIERIIALRVSPVNISVHATDPALRTAMLGNPRAGEALDIMRRFAAAGITMNCQIVCCPGLNDGAALARTMEDLKALYPAVRSVSVVPVGLTRYRDGLPQLTPFSEGSARGVVEQVTQFGNKCMEELGTRLVFCSDELYQKAGLPLPPDGFYEEHVQLENGVGMLRLLEAEFESALCTADAPDGVPFSIATGAAAAPMIEKLLFSAREKYGKLNGRVYTIRNDFFGSGVTVAGLVTGGDLISQLRGRDLGARLLISADMLRREEVDFLDSVPLGDAAEALGVPIYPVACDGGALCDAMFGILPEIPQPAADAEETEYNKYN
jgi:putative radical SAM enzyme (TIGR03279 family)